MWILDNSVIIKWFFNNENLHEKALSVRNAVVESPAQFAIPNLCHSELIHVLSRKSKCDLVFVNQCVSVFLRMGIRTFGLSENALAKAAELACNGLSGYDATYLALAHDLRAQWLTADEKAAQKDTAPYSLWLGAY